MGSLSQSAMKSLPVSGGPRPPLKCIRIIPRGDLHEATVVPVGDALHSFGFGSDCRLFPARTDSCARFKRCEDGTAGPDSRMGARRGKAAYGGVRSVCGD